MFYAEWSGKTVVVKNHNRQLVRRINVHHDVIGVQVSGNSETEAIIAIAQSHGRTDLYKTNGQLYRRG